jgi:hypothetical protein
LIGKEVFSDRAFRSIIHSINFDLCKHLKNTFENAGGIAAGRYGGMIMKQRIRNKQFTGIAVFLTLLLVCLAAGMTPAHAAAARVFWYDGEQETSMSVESGSKFYIGDFARIFSGNMMSTASMGTASYRTKDAKVAAVNGKGYLKAKKAGVTDVTVTCQGKTLTCHLTVEKKGTFEQSAAVKELRAAAKSIAKGIPKKLTAAKAYTLKKKRDAYLVSYGSNSAHKLSYEGFLYENERPVPDTVSDARSERLAVPEAGRYLTVQALLRQFMLANDPTSVRSKKTMRISSASGSVKSGKFTVKLAGKLSAEQIFAAQLAFPEQNGVSAGKTKAGILMTIYDQTANKYYKGQAELKKGSRQLSVQTVSRANGGYQKAELVKDHVYLLGSKLNWANGYKVTIK